MADNLTIAKAVWDTATPQFKSRIPEPSQENLERIGVLISSDNYKNERNEIYNALVNVIGMQKVHQQSLTNPLKMFKGGSMRLGDTYEEMMSDVIEAQTFRISEDDQFKKWSSKVKSAYHKINREDYYPVTIEETKINRAFRTTNGLQNLINSITNQMYSSNDLDEFLYTKQTIQEYYFNNEIPILDSQKIVVPDITINPLDKEQIRLFIIAVKSAMKRMRFANRNYNPMGMMLECKPSDMVIVMRSELTVIDEVSNLSQAFRPQYMDINVPIVEVDDFGEGMENVQAIAMDKESLRILDVLRTTRTAENGRALYRNYFYHVHQLYMFSPFMPCIFFIKE